MTREIIFDTETTGMDPQAGDRIVEIGAVELINHIPSGREYHVYINPERDIPAEATAVHGITLDKVKDSPVFSQEFMNFLDFVGSDSKLVAHNASFDMNFINHHLKQVGHPGIKNDRVIDSLDIARKKFLGSPANLDALCRRFAIDLSERTVHGALLDSQLLAEVWLELNGGRQHGLEIEEVKADNVLDAQVQRTYREPRSFTVPDDELAAHSALMDKLKDPVWAKVKQG